MNRSIYLALYFLLCIPVINAQVSPAFKITAATRNYGDCFGTGVAIDGSYAVVGLYDYYSDNDLGSAIIFERDAAGNWNQSQILIPSDVQPGDRFGVYTAISGNYIAISAFTADWVGPDSTMTNSGAVYIFEKDPGGVWQEVAKITAPDPHSYDCFGSLAISGKYLAVGSYNNSYDVNGANYKAGSGAAYVFERTDGGQWLPVQKLTASDRAVGNWFGWGLAVDGYTKTIVIGAPRSSTDVSGTNTISGTGAAYVFKRDAAGNWNQTQKLTASAPHPGANFGASVDISGNWILIGAEEEHYDENEVYNQNNEGAAYLFEDNGTGSWTQKRKLRSHDGYNGDLFGRSVSLDGNYALIGSLGGKNEHGTDYIPFAGSAYLYERNGSTWSLKKKLVAPDRSLQDEFGISVSISGDQIIIGAPKEDYYQGGVSTWLGAAYIFTILNPLGMEEGDLSSVSVYPNPTDGNLTISGEQLFTELVLTDVTGKVVDQTSLSPSGMISYSINQPEGVYFLKIIAGKSLVVKKILVR